MAFAATRGVGSSVARHRYVRKLREFYRLNKALFAENAHYFLLCRAPITDWDGFLARLTTLLESQKPKAKN